MPVRRFRAPAGALVLLSCLLPSLGLAQASSLIISEYIEGSSFNKAVEIYNGTGAPVDLSDYEIRLFSNGANSPSSSLALSGMLADGDVYVAAHGSADAAILAVADVTSSGTINWNGDDAFTLHNVVSDTVVDSFGRVDEDPGSAWTGGGLSTSDRTLVRMDTVCEGDSIEDDAFDPSSEFIGYANNTFTELGSHTANCGTAGPTITINDVAQLEGDGPGTTDFIFTVTLTADATAEFSVTYTLVDGDATGGVDYDNSGSGGTVTFTGGDAGSQQIVVPVIGDTDAEGDETFTVVLSDVSAGDAVIGDDTGLGTITNDDAFPPQLSVDSPSAFEGDAGSTLLRFTVSLDADASEAFSVMFQTADGSATTADSDYLAFAGQLNFAGTAGETQSFDVTVLSDLAVEADETLTVILSNISAGDAVFAPGGDTGTGTILNDDATNNLRIHDVQGSGATTPFSGQVVKIPGAIVTAVTISPPAEDSGFFIQSADGDADALDGTSEGIFVYTNVAPTVSVGDVVTVIGQATEFFRQTQIGGDTESGGPGPASVVRVDGSVGVTAGLPAPVEFSAASGIPSSDPAALSCLGSGPGGTNNVDTNFECFEGMRVTMPDAIVTRSNQRRNGIPYAEVFIMPTGERSRREQGVNYPLAPVPGENEAAGQFDSNPELLEMDADEAGLAFAGITAGTRFNGTGVIGFSFGDYEFYPTELNLVDIAVVPEAVMPSVGGDELTVGSFNMLFLCDNSDGTGCSSQPDEATKLARIADYVLDVLGAPDVLGVQEVENLDILELLAAEISSQTAGSVAYTALLAPAPGSTQNIGFLVRDGRVANPVATQFFAGDNWNDPGDTEDGLDILHDRPPLLLEAEFLGPNGPYDFAVLNNHTKARFNVDDGGTFDAQRDRAKRFLQARDIAMLVQDFQTASGDFAGQGTDQVPLILVGDYNAFEYTDGYVDVVGLIAGTYDDDANECELVQSNGAGTIDCNLGPNIVDPPLYNTAFSVPLDERISYLFTQNYGQVQGYGTPNPGRDVPGVQVIDHILLARSAQGFFLGTDYGIANNAAPEEDRANSTGAVGSSDHDGVVTYLDFNCTANAVLDGDGDLVCGMLDNCPDDANAGQEDLDGDGAGDACDPDIDGDGVANGDDAFPSDPNESADSDSDTIGDNADNCPLVANPGQEDGNGDGVGDACAVAEIAVELGADLAVAPGSDFEVTVNVTSAGPQPAEGVSLVLQVPANVQFVGLDTSGSPVCDTGLLGTSGGTISCELGEIAALDGLDLTFRFTALAASSGGELPFEATVATTTGGDDAGDNTAQGFVNVGAGAPNGEIFSDDFEG